MLAAVINNFGVFKFPRDRTTHMARPRKRHVQMPLHLRTHGGARPGAGRPAKGPRASERHAKRPTLLASQPVHVTARVARDLGSLRTRDMYKAIRWATIAVAARDNFRIVHLSIQGDHLHLIAEAGDRMALARGMQAFEISAAKHVNRTASRRRGRRRRGSVFPDRYHARILNSPKSVKRAISYVLNNWRRHREDRSGRARSWLVDPFSSAISFPGWLELASSHLMWKRPPTYEPLAVWRPKTWLLRLGWQRAGAISALDVPGPLDAAGKSNRRPVPGAVQLIAT
jgi:REP element-mobilizing transposase RayT